MYDIRIMKYNQFGIYQPSRVSLLKPLQNNLSDPEAYSELCQISKMDCLVKIVNNQVSSRLTQNGSIIIMI